MSLLAGYYAAINAEKAAQTDATYAQAQLTRQQSAQVAPNAESQRALQGAQQQGTQQQARKTGAEADQVGANAVAGRGLDAARANQTDVTSSLAPGIANSENALRGAQTTSANTANAINSYQNAPHVDAGYGGMPSMLGSLPTLGGSVSSGSAVSGVDPLKAQGDQKGGKVVTEKDRIQGKANKPGPTDTVPTMLTPGEAVLNKGAAEHYGSDVIDHMNKMGLMRMAAQTETAGHLGLADPHAAPAKAKGKGDATPAVQGFFRGTSHVKSLDKRHGGMPIRKKKA